ncbi:hypothetical protein AYO20_04962 [Fonsecaea nubica]|uniref:C2H2-type domain-containing protein n=1 Tax=Fonsecaea nubica TaxID=856822 RepID=A0A178D2S3_9EURO|nr:hypothetical protein AYO20_04962 [Fonsecaea nubica]OAL35812.1 hypothetical protein AYO20_04962 [Fonsecaea nubica]
MTFKAPNMLGLAVLLTWACLSSTAHPHPLFKKFLPSQSAIEILFSALSISFAPGLFEVLQASGPPTVEWFMQLPTHCEKVWAIYLLVLWKLGCMPRVYLGSGTEADSGVTVRFKQYDKLIWLPSHVQESLGEGYQIVHKGVLVWMPIPPPAEVPVLRLLFVCLEGALTFALRALSKRANYTAALADLCPWDRNSLEYEGLCSHNPLVDPVKGQFDLTPGEREEHAQELKDRKYILNLEGRERRKAEDPEAYRLEANRHRANFVKNNPESAKNSTQRHKVKAREEKRFYCNVCHVAFTNSTNLRNHLATKRHENKVKDAKGTPRYISPTMKIQNRIKAQKRHYCELCDFAAPTPFALKKHIDGKAHKKKLALAEEAAQEPISPQAFRQPESSLVIQQQEPPKGFQEQSSQQKDTSQANSIRKYFQLA